MWQENYAELEGLRFRYFRAGAGKTVVMLHGVTDNGRCWGRTADALAQEFDVILMDLRAHGLSSGPPSGYHLDHFAADVHGLLSELGLDEVMLVGHSLGARIALCATANNPARISRIVLIDPPVPNEPQQTTLEARYEWFAWLRALRTKSLDDLITMQTAATPAWSEDEIYYWAESKLQVNPVLWGEGGIVLDSNWRDQMKKVGDLPVQLVCGEVEKGALVSPEIAVESDAILQNGEIVMINNAGHSIYRDQYEDTVAAILPFLQA